jgi:hypothetical protein
MRPALEHSASGGAEHHHRRKSAIGLTGGGCSRRSIRPMTSTIASAVTVTNYQYADGAGATRTSCGGMQPAAAPLARVPGRYTVAHPTTRRASSTDGGCCTSTVALALRTLQRHRPPACDGPIASTHVCTWSSHAPFLVAHRGPGVRCIPCMWAYASCAAARHRVDGGSSRGGALCNTRTIAFNLGMAVRGNSCVKHSRTPHGKPKRMVA